MKIKKNFYKTIAFVLSVSIIVSVCSLVGYAKDKNYPCVFVHGMMGWGAEDEQYESMPYWGMTTDEGDLMQSLNSRGYDCYAASVGPLSSAWDRACELYAQLSGTVVDYGEAHSKEHNHARYGKSYVDNALIDNFGETKINLFGHSFGGNTIRLFAYIMENGVYDEVNATGSQTSDFFKDGKGNYINSITTLASPHNGSMIADLVYDMKVPMYMIGVVSNVLGCLGITKIDAKFYQYALSTLPGEKNVKLSLKNIINFATDKDNCLYDLTIGGAQELNDTMGIVDEIYYFSYACSGTTEHNGYQEPTEALGSQMSFTAWIIGHSKGMTISGIKFEGDWLKNDGMVPLASGLFPLNEQHITFDSTIGTIKSGIWYVMPVVTGNHGTLLGAGLSGCISFYTEHIDLINNL